MNVKDRIEITLFNEATRETVAMGPEGYKYIYEIAGENEMTVKEVIGQALVLFKHAKDEARNGLAIGATKDASKLDVEFTGL